MNQNVLEQADRMAYICSLASVSKNCRVIQKNHCHIISPPCGREKISDQDRMDNRIQSHVPAVKGTRWNRIGLRLNSFMIIRLLKSTLWTNLETEKFLIKHTLPQLPSTGVCFLTGVLACVRGKQRDNVRLIRNCSIPKTGP